MAETPPVIAAILKEKKITDLLESRGIFPERESAGRLAYLCPIHEGDSAPSFMVFTDGEHQTYKCFGCHSGSDVINLLCDLDKVTLGNAIHTLSDGITVEQANVLSTLVTDGQKISTDYVSNSKDLEVLMLKIGVSCRSYLTTYRDGNEEDIDFFLNIYNMIDKVIRENDAEALEEMYKIICKYSFSDRIELYFERKENRILNEARSWRR